MCGLSSRQSVQRANNYSGHSRSKVISCCEISSEKNLSSISESQRVSISVFSHWSFIASPVLKRIHYLEDLQGPTVALRSQWSSTYGDPFRRWSSRRRFHVDVTVWMHTWVPETFCGTHAASTTTNWRANWHLYFRCIQSEIELASFWWTYAKWEDFSWEVAARATFGNISLGSISLN